MPFLPQTSKKNIVLLQLAFTYSPSYVSYLYVPTVVQDLSVRAIIFVIVTFNIVFERRSKSRP